MSCLLLAFMLGSLGLDLYDFLLIRSKFS